MDTITPAQALHQRILAARRDHRRAERELALLLVEMAGHYAHLGYASLGEYAGVHLDLSARQTRELVRLGRRLPELPVLDAALRAGSVGWAKARELLRVLTPDTEAEWVARAKDWSVRRLERELATAAPGQRPSDEAVGGPPRRRLVFEMESADARLVADALALLRARTELGRDEVEDGALLAAMARQVLATGADEPRAAAEDDRAEAGEAAAAADAVEGLGSSSVEAWRVVVDLCPGCGEHRVGDEEVSQTVADELACDHERVDLRPGPTQGHVRRSIPPATRRTVLTRHRGRCAAPGCHGRLWLHLHHLRSRACGGGNEADNLVPLCSAHHRAVHGGQLALERDDRGRLVLTHADGRRRVGAATHVGRGGGRIAGRGGTRREVAGADDLAGGVPELPDHRPVCRTARSELPVEFVPPRGRGA